METIAFDYFQASTEEMANLLAEERECSFCGNTSLCFKLDNALGCLACLKAGRFEFWHDTEIGVLDEDGLTQVYKHNRMPSPDFLKSALVALRRTPQILTWQQELWLTHCNDFMVYIGTWEPKDFYQHSPTGDGRALFYEMTDEWQNLRDDSLAEGEGILEKWHATYYVFECKHCGKLRGNWDCD